MCNININHSALKFIPLCGTHFLFNKKVMIPRIALLLQWENHNLQPSQPTPAPLYEDIIVTTVVKDKDELELKDNVACGHLR